MDLSRIIKASLFLSIGLVLLGVVFRISHLPGSEFVLILNLLSLGTFAVCSIYEVRSSNKIDASEKNMWTIGLIFITLIVGLVYYFSGRKRVVAAA